MYEQSPAILLGNWGWCKHEVRRTKDERRKKAGREGRDPQRGDPQLVIVTHFPLEHRQTSWGRLITDDFSGICIPHSAIRKSAALPFGSPLNTPAVSDHRNPKTDD